MPSTKRHPHVFSFGEHLAQIRIHLHLSQETLAEAISTTARSISRWEQNQAFPQNEHLKRLCKVLQVSPGALIGGEEKEQGVTSQKPLLWYVPYTRNFYFTGREALLWQLRERLKAEKRVALTQPQILSGLGGIGKTQIALEYAYRYRDNYRAVLWVEAETTKTLMADYRALAHLFQLPEKDNSDTYMMRDAVKRWFQNHTRWLLIYDNVEDLELLQTALPDVNQGHILITTRSQIIGTLGVHIDLQKMELEEATLLLLRRAKLLRSDQFLAVAEAPLLAQAKELVELLDSFPLALDQAGAYIEETACGLTAYLEHYTTQRQVVLNTRGTLCSVLYNGCVDRSIQGDEREGGQVIIV